MNLRKELNYTYWDAGHDTDITVAEVVICNKCDTLHFPDGSFQFEAVAKEYEEKLETYIPEIV